MNAKQFKQAADLFLRAKQTAPEARPALLDEEAADPEVRGEVERLLHGALRPTPFAALAADVGVAREALRTVDLPRAQGPSEAPADRESAGAAIGRYKLLQLIGEGGFGSVFMAEQEVPVRRRVALKVIKLGMDTKQVIARFEAERQALAMMDHPNIAKVFDAGTTDSGRPYFVMELVKGIPITQYCDGNKLPPRDRLRLFIQVCQAVQHAHQKGVIHRDIKPSNVLVTLHDGIPVPKVIDFGIAKATQARLTERTLFTEFRQLVGTPEYMSPEQAELSGLDIDTRSDVYGLGVLLYELLTGTTPLDGARLRSVAYEQMRRIIREEEAIKPSTRLSTLGDALASVAARRATDPTGLGRIVRGDLDWIVMRALEKDRTRRYETASALGQDVGRYLSDEPVVAGPPTMAYRLRKLARRHRVVIATAAIVAAAALVGVGSLGYAYERTRSANSRTGTALLAAQRSGDEARLQKAKAEAALAQVSAARGAAESRGYTAGVIAVDASLQLGEADTARAQLARLPEALRGFEWDYLDRQADASIRTMNWERFAVDAAAISGDWKTLATATAGRITIWSPEPMSEQRVFRDFPTETPVASIALSPDGGRVAAFTRLGMPVRVWDAAGGKQLAALDLAADDGGIPELRFSPGGDRLAAFVPGARHRMVRVWDVAGAKLLWSSNEEDNVLTTTAAASGDSVSFVADGTRLVWAGAGGWARVCDAETGVVKVSVRLPWAQVTSVSFRPDGAQFAAGGADGSVRILDATAGRELRALPFGVGPVRTLAWSRDGARIAAAAGKVVRLCDPASAEPPAVLVGHSADVVFVAFSEDGKRIMSASRDRVVKVWDATDSGQIVRRYPNGSEAALTAVSAASPVAATISSDQPLRLWDVSDGRTLGTFRRVPLDAAAAFSADGGRLAVSGADGTVDLLDARTAAPTGRLRGLSARSGHVTALAFSPDGRRIAIGGYAGGGGGPLPINPKPELLVCDVPSGAERLRLGGDGQPVARVAWSPDAQRIAATDATGTLRLWDATTGKVLYAVDGSGAVVEFSRDGTSLLTGGPGGQLSLRDAPTGQVRATTRAHPKQVTSARFSPDGRRIISAGGEHRVMIVEAQTLDGLLALDAGADVYRVGFSADGKSVLADAGDHVVVWDSRGRHGDQADAFAPGVNRQRRVEMVMSPGMAITATTAGGTITMTAGEGFERSFTWDGATRSVVMWPRTERWYGSLGLYFPGPGEHWADHHGITRAVVEEGQQHFVTTEEAMQWLKMRTWMPYVYRDDGLVVGWTTLPRRKTLQVEVWQLYVNGKKPTELPGSQNDTIVVRNPTQR